MFLRNLRLVNFKNYTDSTFDFSSKVNCLVGPNGSGKTNLLDAIYYLCMTKSYFPGTDRDNVRHGETAFILNGKVEKKDAQRTLKCAFGKDRKKEFLEDEVKYNRLSEHVGAYPVIFVTPDDQQIITGGSEDRRKYLDSLLCQIDRIYLDNLQEYNRILTQRNALLKQVAQTGRRDETLIKAYDEKLKTPAQYVHQKRQEIIKEILPHFNNIYRVVSGEKEEVGFDYESQLNDEAIGSLLLKAREKDIILKRTTVGIHRDELTFTMNDHKVKRFGSQGQQKSFLLALKLSQFKILKHRTGLSPFLLLDDIFDKLDDQRCGNLLSLIHDEDFGQIFISDTHKERMEEVFGDKASEVAIFQIDEEINN